MKLDNPKSTAQVAGHPIHPMLIPFPIAFLVGALVTDIVYTQTADGLWATLSAILLVAGIVTALVAALAGLRCPLLSGPSAILVWTMKEVKNAIEEAQAGGDHRQAA
jgi:uncharacterized membrane protein